MGTSKLIISITGLLMFLLGCQKQEDVSLSGKIKTSKLVVLSGSDSIDFKYDYQYNSDGKLEKIILSSDFMASIPALLYQFQYQADKVILSDSSSVLAVFYLQHDTNLIDSIISYNNGENRNGIKVLRASNHNILKIIPAQEPGPLSANYFVDSFVYVGNEIKSYLVVLSSFGVNLSNHYEISYNVAQSKRVDNDFFQLDNKSGFAGFSSYLFNDFSVLGISLGNTNTHSISSVKHIDLNSTLPEWTTTNYTYLENTPASLAINYSSNPLSGSDFIQLRNTYYP